ncbi:phage head morphogenesis protein, partial [Acinetobacter baumannii]
DVWQEEHADKFTVARSAGYDVLGDIYSAVQKALADGQTIQQATKDLTPILQAKGWWGKQWTTDPLTGERVVSQLGSERRLQTI